MPKVDKKVTKDSRTNQTLRVTCRECKGSTNHAVLSDVKIHHSQEWHDGMSFEWIDEYEIIQCQGCESISFREEHSNSEDYFVAPDGSYGYDVTTHVYPNPEEGRVPVADYKILPSKLQRIYAETLKSINSDQPVLTGVGIRAIVETVCKDKKAKGTGLSKKIDDLVKQGVLTGDGAKILHKLRTLGNKAAHEVEPHDNVQLGLAFDVIDHLLQGVYILPHHAQSKFK